MEISILIIFFFECVLDVYQWVEIEVNLEIKECLYQGTVENSIEPACCCHGPAVKHLMSKQKENPGRQKLITLLFSGYMETFLFCWQWLEKYFIIKAALHGHFLMIIDLFFYFCHWKYLNTSPVVEKLDGRKNLTYSRLESWLGRILLFVFIIKGISPLGDKSRDDFLCSNIFCHIGWLEPIISITGKHGGEK